MDSTKECDVVELTVLVMHACANALRVAVSLFCFPFVLFTSGTNAGTVTAAALSLSLCNQQLSPREKKYICCSYEICQQL